MIKALMFLFVLLFLSACGSEQSEQDHILQHQTDALEKSWDVEDVLKEAEKRRSESVRKQGE